MSTPPMDVVVSAIRAEDAAPWILNKHYARRKCPVTFAFGAFAEGRMIGIVTYGTPASSTLRIGIAGIKWSPFILELNRLCCESIPNVASILVGRSLQMLPKPRIVVSYADTAQGHVGYVYQATNFIYTGLSAKANNYRLKSDPSRHTTTITDKGRGSGNLSAVLRAEEEDGEYHPIAQLKKKYGDDLYTEERPRKHRYLYLCGDRRERRQMRAELLYQAEPYPKGETKRYVIAELTASADQLAIAGALDVEVQPRRMKREAQHRVLHESPELDLT